jgi:hypothetical protein
MEVLSCLEAKPIDDPFIIAQRDEIDYSVRYERENAVRWRDLWKLRKQENDTKTLRRLLLGAGSQFMQQFGGINIMSYYLPTVLMNVSYGYLLQLLTLWFGSSKGASIY